MQSFPLADPGTPDLRSPARYLWRVVRLQRWTVLGGMVFGVVWMGGQALVPYVLGRVVDEGIAGEDPDALLRWVPVLVALAVVQGVSGHDCGTASPSPTGSRDLPHDAVGERRRRSASAPRCRPARSTGEVVSVGATDTVAVGRALDISARGTGAVVAFLLVAVLLLSSSAVLGAVVLLGVPLFCLALGPALRPLHARQAAQRGALGDLTTSAPTPSPGCGCCAASAARRRS